jgi:peptidyl-prolyl cis-trans isomerase D
MSIIQDIRDKYAKLTVALIALALIGFILTDYFQSSSRMGRGTSNTIGSVNGRSINYDEFNKKVDQMQENMKAQGYPQTPGLYSQALEQAWNQQVTLSLLEEEADKLGITVGKKELGDVLYGPNAPEDFKKAGMDEKGNYDPVRAKQQVDLFMKNKTTTAEQKAAVNNEIEQLKQQRVYEKYTSLLGNSVNFPRWFVEKQNADNSQMAKISFVRELYSSIPDSTIKIEDKEIADYINKHKEDFQQPESRSISYVSFSAAPSAADSAAAKNSLLDLKSAFDSASNNQDFLVRQGVGNYYGGYINGKTIQVAAKDSIFRTPVGVVYGPYLDGGSYVMAKLEGVKQAVADTAKVRHILIGTQSRDSATASKLIDSIKTAIAGGANFDSLCVKYSEDPGKTDRNTGNYSGGIYDNVTPGQMIHPFNDFIFQNSVGTKGVVKTDFGFHYIEILSQKGSGGPAYKIAYFPKEITASQNTDDEANNNAQKFAGSVKDVKSFDQVFEKEWAPKGYKKGIGANIPKTGADINGIGVSRPLVRMIYDASVGDVLKPERVGENYVVAVVTESLSEGTASVERVRTYIEPMLKNKKKAEILKQKAGKISTLEAAATAWGGGKTIEVADSLRMSGSSASKTLGNEPRVTGAAFNPANKDKVVPEALEGISGVYVVRVDAVSATAYTPGDVADQRKQMALQAKSNSQQNNALGALRAAAKVKDNRSKRF